MKRRIVLRAEAESEFDEAFDYYDSQRQGLGAAFATEVQTAFDRITSTPFLAPLVLADIRRKPLRRFPYCVYYRVLPERIEVVSVFHTSRDPSVWQERI